MNRDLEAIARRMALSATKVNEAVKPLLDLDGDGRTCDFNVSLALTVIASVAGSLLAQKNEDDDRLLSTFWNAVTDATDTNRVRVLEVRAAAAAAVKSS